MKVIILTEGSNKLGIGHIIREIAIYQAFVDKNIKVQMIVIADQSTKELLKGIDKRIGLQYQIFNWLKEKKKIFNLVKKEDIVIIDSMLAKRSFYEEISKSAALSVYLDDNQRFSYPKGIVINRSIFAEELNYPKKEGVYYLLGTKYLPLTKAFWHVPTKTIRKKIENIMVIFGGSDFGGMTYKVISFLNKNYPQMLKTVIVSNFFSNLKEIDNIKDKKTEIIYSPSGEVLKNIMFNADLAISASGQTLYELARVGVPTISIKVINNQRNNVRGWKKVKFIEHAGFRTDKNLFITLKKLILKLESITFRKKKVEIGRKFVDGKGSKRIVDYILERYKNLKTL